MEEKKIRISIEPWSTAAGSGWCGTCHLPTEMAVLDDVDGSEEAPYVVAYGDTPKRAMRNLCGVVGEAYIRMMARRTAEEGDGRVASLVFGGETPVQASNWSMTEDGRRAVLNEALRSLPNGHPVVPALCFLAKAADSIENEVRAWEDAFDCMTPDEALQRAVLEPSPTILSPPGSHGVSIRPVCADPPIAIITFEPSGVLGPDRHDVAEHLCVLSGSVDLHSSQHVVGGLEQAERLMANVGTASKTIPSGRRHELRAWPSGAVVVVVMGKPVAP